MIHVVTGPPCAGKSTHVATKAAAGDIVIDFDKLATAFGNPTAHAASGDLREVAQIARKAAIARVLDGVGPDAWIIHTWPDDAQLESYKAAGADFTEIDPGVDVALERAAADERPQGTEGAIRSWYDRREGKAMTVTQEDRRYHAFASAVLKAEEGGELGPGEFTATASVFDVIDSYGEVVRKGAFAESIAQMKASGDPIPIVWQHDWHDPFSHIGYIKSIQETETALLYHGVLDIADNPKAAQVYRLMKGRRVMQQSFGYDVLAGGRATVDGVDVYEITNVKLHEVGPCLVGVNNNTRLLGIKSSDGTDVRAVPVAPSATTSGQAETTITEDPTIPASVPEVEPASVPEPSAVKSISPASALLFADIFDIPEGE